MTTDQYLKIKKLKELCAELFQEMLSNAETQVERDFVDACGELETCASNLLDENQNLTITGRAL